MSAATRTRRPPVSFVAWTPTPAGAVDIAKALGGEAKAFDTLGISRGPDSGALPRGQPPHRLYLAVRRPRAVIVTHPPLFPALIGFLYSRHARVPFVLDSHISAFGLAGDRLSGMLPFHAGWLRARPPPSSPGTNSLRSPYLGAPCRGRPRASDGVAYRAAGPLSGRPRSSSPVCSRATSRWPRWWTRPGRCPRSTSRDRRPASLPRCLRASAPPNVTFVGFLGPDDSRAVLDADMVLSLSTERVSVMRTAYEAVYAERPLVVPDRPLLRDLFPFAVHADSARRASRTACGPP